MNMSNAYCLRFQPRQKCVTRYKMPTREAADISSKSLQPSVIPGRYPNTAFYSHEPIGCKDHPFQPLSPNPPGTNTPLWVELFYMSYLVFDELTSRSSNPRIVTLHYIALTTRHNIFWFCVFCFEFQMLSFNPLD